MTDSEHKNPLDFQSIMFALQNYWARQGCLIWQPYYSQVGAGTMNPATFLRGLAPEPWKVAYVEPSVRPDDGRLWLVGVYGRSRAGMLRLLPGFYSGHVSRRPGLLVQACQSVNITSVTSQEIEFDGDPRGFLPAHIELLPRAMTLVGGTYD